MHRAVARQADLDIGATPYLADHRIVGRRVAFGSIAGCNTHRSV
jgi:hypothetical protein